ncbi:MAG: DUF503 domain-containing protein [Candidatus Latescibacterota bacterium]|nr:MAG: DUF503 domain-containing protein [Candidatus Latescibacterota bacterium]
MIVKLLTIDLHLPGRSSLKEKRFVMSSVKTKLRRQFNVAVSEIDHHDKWQRATLAVLTVGVDGAAVESTCGKVLKHLERDHRLMILECTQEIR